MPRYRNALPQLSGDIFLPDDGSPRLALRDYDVSQVLRGGSWRCAATQLAPGHRGQEQQDTWSDDIGFRLTLSLGVPARN